MKDLISVVIPVYNVAQYLPECLESLLSQDYAKLEIILIVSWGSAGSKAPNSRGEMRDGPGEGCGDRKPPCSEKSASVRWRHIFLFCMQKENFFVLFLHGQLSPPLPPERAESEREIT